MNLGGNRSGPACGRARPWCVIPAAGRGSRLDEHAAARPKTLLRVGGRTILDHLLDGLAPEIAGACVVVGPGTGQLPAVASSGIPLRFVVQSEPTGVAGAIAAAAPAVPGTFAVVMGDTYYHEPLAPQVARWRRSGLPGAVLVEEIRERPTDPAGFAKIRDGEVNFIWKGHLDGGEPAVRRVAGLVVLPPAAFRTCLEVGPAAATGELEVEDVVNKLLNDGYRFLALPYRGWRRNVNTPADLRRVEAHLAGGTSGTTSSRR